MQQLACYTKHNHGPLPLLSNQSHSCACNCDHSSSSCREGPWTAWWFKAASGRCMRVYIPWAPQPLGTCPTRCPHCFWEVRLLLLALRVGSLTAIGCLSMAIIFHKLPCLAMMLCKLFRQAQCPCSDRCSRYNSEMHMCKAFRRFGICRSCVTKRVSRLHRLLPKHCVVPSCLHICGHI